MKVWGLVSCLLIVTLAGCASEAPVEPTALPETNWSGKLQTLAFNPVIGAAIRVEHPAAVYDDGSSSAKLAYSNATSNEFGEFTLKLPLGSWNWTISHPEFETATGTVVPNGTLDLLMTPLFIIVPYQRAYPFSGTIECAAEYLIITPSCDTLIQFAGEETGAPVPAVFTDDSVFEIAFEEEWKTAVLDLQFDLADHPGVAGLRVSAYAAEADAELFSYERIQQAVSAESFTLRLEPGVDYGDAAMAPIGAGGLRFEFFPHGHGDDTVCTPDGTCFLGVAATYKFTFEAVATIFYHEAAPEGWTLLA